jgi:tRNA-modifying protein YgfZ
MMSEQHEPETGVRPAPGTPEAGAEPSDTITSTVIRLEGRDALGLLHRISTQSLEELAPGHVRSTLFCDFRGRLLHRAAVAPSRDGIVWLLRPDSPPEELAGHIERHVFREDVRVAAEDALTVRAVADGFGEPAGTLVEEDGVPRRLQIDAGFGLGVEPAGGAGPADDERRRIHSGRPRHGHEIHPDFNPYEIGLAHEVHLNKGCFTGQEALMRLVTYQSVRRRLVRLSGTGSPPPIGSDVVLAGEPVGRLTSTAADENGWVALAVLKYQALESRDDLTLAGSRPIDALFPFPETRPLGLP